MKGEISRSEIQNVHGRQMGSSKTNNSGSFKSEATPAMNLRSANFTHRQTPDFVKKLFF